MLKVPVGENDFPAPRYHAFECFSAQSTKTDSIHVPPVIEPTVVLGHHAKIASPDFVIKDGRAWG